MPRMWKRCVLKERENNGLDTYRLLSSVYKLDFIGDPHAAHH